MTRTYRWLLLAIGMAVVAMAAGAASAADPAKVSLLIIDGQNGHDWKATTPVIKELLDKTGRFAVDVLTSPPKKAPKEEWAKFKPDFSKYQVVLTNYCGDPWPDDVKAAFEKYMNDGGGFVVYHFAVAAFQDWDAYNKMIGQGWRKTDFGNSLVLDENGKEVCRKPGDGPGGSHGPAHQFEVTIRDKEHPICKGMPEKWVHVKDELYHGQRGPAQNMHILASAFDEKDKGGTGLNELMAWTVSFGKGRVFVTLLGHDAPPTVEPGAAALLVRGAEWAGTGAVTIPAPKEIPTPPPEPPAPPKAPPKKADAKK
jgi:hypothetical protein